MTRSCFATVFRAKGDPNLRDQNFEARKIQVSQSLGSQKRSRQLCAILLKNVLLHPALGNSIILMYELSGTVKQIFEEKTFGSGFNLREFVVTTEADKYPQDICLQCIKEKVEMVNQLKEGEKVKVSFDLRGREYQGRYFVNLNAWKVETAGAGSDSSSNGDEPPPFDPSDEILDEEPPF